MQITFWNAHHFSYIGKDGKDYRNTHSADHTVLEDVNALHTITSNPYIGKDCKDYYTRSALDAANKAYMMQMYPYKGLDGQDYPTHESLERANEQYRRVHHRAKPTKRVR